MKRFLKWFISGPAVRGLLVAVVLIAGLTGMPLLQAIDQAIYDQMVRLRSSDQEAAVVIVAIDRDSIAKIGNWPWPRSYLAGAIGQVGRQKPFGIGLHLVLPDEEWNPGLAGLRTLQGNLGRNERKAVGQTLAEMASAIDGDGQLVASVRSAGTVVVPYQFLHSTVAGTDEELDDLPPFLKVRNPDADWQTSLASLHNPVRNWCRPAAPDLLQPSFRALADAASLQGHVSLNYGLNGRPHSLQLLRKYDNRLFPAMALQLAGVARGKTNPYLKVDGSSLLLNGSEIATGDDFEVFVNPVSVKGLTQYSFIDVANGHVPENAFTDKIVLIGLTTATVSSGGVVSVSHPAPVEAAAAVTADLIARRETSRPFWAFLLELSVLAYLGIFLVIVLPRFQFVMGALLQLLFLASWFIAVATLLALKGLWFQVSPHLLLVAAGLALIALQRVRSKGTQTFEDLKMLGLSFQSQGMLDMAFDKFRECPVSDKSIREILYNLGLDFERKRMFNKAVAVYSHLLKGGKFKDAKKKVAELKEMEQSVRLGGNGSRDGTMVIGRGATAPTLGRYEVVRELGQGAMGTVYLGRDPKINREVAIKTLNLHDVEPDQLKDVKERFFREAEAAGRLNHPNIVTIYDAGEEHDLAFMAMELLTGKDLSARCGGKDLLKPVDVMRIAAEVADALAYAHANDVVHRDIKPSNLMLLESGQVKVTDFGIARVVNSSQTQTGTILGTPSYMSPEQVSGDKVKGSSDLFSLGVVCYELFSGQKPFVGDSLGALMHNIANVKYTPLKKVRPDLPECCYAVVRKLLKKEPRDRYRNAADVADALRKCIGKAG